MCWVIKCIRVVWQVCRKLQRVQTVTSWLEGATTHSSFVDAALPARFVQRHVQLLRDTAADKFNAVHDFVRSVFGTSRTSTVIHSLYLDIINGGSHLNKANRAVANSKMWYTFMAYS